jgi:YVTN family beta-propeller protein
MRKLLLLLLLLPMALQAQVYVDTVIKLPHRPFSCIYLPSVNKLYISSVQCLFVLDCATYSLSRIPTNDHYNEAYECHFAWNWRRDKLYVVRDGDDTLLAIDARTDSIVKQIYYTGLAPAYVSTRDCVYGTSGDLTVIDCATDSIIRRIATPYRTYGTVWWDSVGNKIYASSSLEPYVEMAYSCDNDSLIAVFNSGVLFADKWSFCPEHRRAYYFSRQTLGALILIDTKHDTILGSRDLGINHAIARARDTDKFYVTVSRGRRDDSVFAIDCATDSVVAKVPIPDLAVVELGWTPWDNRLYAVGVADRDSVDCVSVIDCQTDSVIARIGVGHIPRDIGIDTVNQRVYVPCQDESTVYVLRDTTTGVAEPAGVARAVSFSVSPSPAEGHVTITASVPDHEHAVLAVYDAAGRHVRTLEYSEVEPGAIHARWDGTDGRKHVPPGVYVIKLDAGATHLSRKVVLTGR